ncbi:putative monocarboxylate transporter 13 [Apostichopus japonicus]|uniref:Putative monocarboxylate transporter 13 n=1 Tax=Stichopus japonicus TaxID=307972 RepID=A0A2G8LL85_STIJA|nr:putative monocarboxylate transporter 13 [Apostichopus japonicus]
MNNDLTGYVKAAGVLFVEWQEYFQVGSKEVGWVGIILAFFGPTAGLIAGGLTPKFGSRPISALGGVIVAVSIAATAFSKQLWHVYVLSITSSFGLGFAFQPSITVIGFYFKKKIGIANGVAFSGVGAGIVVMPPLLQFLCTTFNWSGALLICGALMLITVLLSLTYRPTDREKYFMLLSGRENQSDETVESKRACSCICGFISNLCNNLGLDLLWRYPRFGLLSLSYCLAGYGYYACVVFLSSRAVYDAGIPKQDASFLVSAIGVGSTIGRAGHGFLIHVKLIGISQLYILAGFGTAISCYLNPLANTFLSLLACSFAFGLFSGSMLAVSLMCARQFLPTASVSRSFGVLILSNGVGIVFGTFTMAGVGFTLASLLPLIDAIYRACCKRDEDKIAEKDEERNYDQENEEEEAVAEEEKESLKKTETSIKGREEITTLFGEERKFMVKEPETSV